MSSTDHYESGFLDKVTHLALTSIVFTKTLPLIERVCWGRCLAMEKDSGINVKKEQQSLDWKGPTSDGRNPAQRLLLVTQDVQAM